MPRKVGLLTPTRREFVKNQFKFSNEYIEQLKKKHGNKLNPDDIRKLEVNMAYEIRQKAKNAIKDLILIAKYAPEKEQEKIFSPDLIRELVKAVISENVDFDDFDNLMSNLRKYKIAKEVLAVSWKTVHNFENVMTRHRPILELFEQALFEAGLWKHCDYKRILKDVEYRAELWEKIKIKGKKEHGDEDYYFKEAKKFLEYLKEVEKLT